MSQFFGQFPRIRYDIGGKNYKNFQTITNIFFRLGIVQKALSNSSSYYEHIIRDEDRPEILAEKLYGNPEAYWIIFLANNIIDYQYDWPLDSASFIKFIIDKYGSVETAQTTYKHYKKNISREETLSGTITETSFIINQANLASSLASSQANVPYDYYNGLAETQEVNTYSVSSRTVIEIINRSRVSYYDYENELNEAKRNIKIIKPEFYPQIKSEFNNLTNKFSGSKYIRRLV